MNDEVMEHITQKVRRLMDRFSRVFDKRGVSMTVSPDCLPLYNELGLALNELLSYVRATEERARDTADILHSRDNDLRLLKIGMTRLRRQLENDEVEIISLINELDKANTRAMELYSEKGELLNSQRRRNDEWAKIMTSKEDALAKSHSVIDNQAARIGKLQEVVGKLETRLKTFYGKDNHRHPQEPVWDAEAEAKAAAMHQPVDVWTCANCGSGNWKEKDACNRCGEAKAKAAAPVERTDYELKHEAALAAAVHNDGPDYHPLQEPAWFAANPVELVNGNYRVSKTEYNGRACVEEYRGAQPGVTGSWYMVNDETNLRPLLFDTKEDAQAYCNLKNAGFASQPRECECECPVSIDSDNGICTKCGGKLPVNDNSDDGLTV